MLSVCATGSDLAQAQARAYEAVDRIDWPEGFCRRDIGWRALAALNLYSRWQAARRPGAISRRSGASWLQRGMAKGQRG